MYQVETNNRAHGAASIFADKGDDLINSTKPPLVVENVSVNLGGVEVLREVSFSVEEAALIGVVGPNGAGKSTLFNTIIGLTQPVCGCVSIFGDQSRGMRGKVAYVPQREQVNWRFPLTAQEVVTLGRNRRLGWLRRPGRRDRDIVRASLERVEMWDRRDSLISELSGGQRQRVFVARALAQEADMLLLDEAFSGVDVASQEGLVAVLLSLRDEGKTILMATHELTSLARRCDKLLCINGHVCAYCAPDEAFTPAVLEELYGAHGITFANGGNDAAAS